MVIGAVFKNNCLYFEDKCGEEGACLAQDVRATAIGITAYFVGIQLLSLTSMVLACYIYNPQKSQPREAVLT